MQAKINAALATKPNFICGTRRDAQKEPILKSPPNFKIQDEKNAALLAESQIKFRAARGKQKFCRAARAKKRRKK